MNVSLVLPRRVMKFFMSHAASKVIFTQVTMEVPPIPIVAINCVLNMEVLLIIFLAVLIGNLTETKNSVHCMIPRLVTVN